MALHRFFAEGPVALTPDAVVLPLGDGDLHHLRDVVRLRPGEEIVLVADGVAYRFVLTSVGDTAEGQLLESLPTSRLPRVTLVQGLAKGEKMDDVVRQVTELGVSRIIPFAAERSVVKLDGAKASARVERWRRIAAEAAKQAQRLDLPSVRAIARLEDLAGMLASSIVLVAWEDAPEAPGIAEAIGEAAGPDADVAVVIGPEGGLTQHEVTALAAAGATVVSLGPTVLRTETAGVVASALALHALGGLGASRA